MLKRLKLEFFYVRKMFQWGYGWHDWHRYILNKFFSLQLLARIKPISCPRDDGFEIHTLAPRSGLWMAYWTVRSFLYHSGLCPRIIIHDDGSIDERTAAMFESKLANAKVLYKSEAEKMFYADPNIPDIVKKYRRECKNFYIMMFLDHFFLSSTCKVMVLDNDMLFYDRPTEIIEFMRGNSGVDAIYAAYSGSNPVDMDEEYQKKYAAILADASRLNSGLMVFDKSKIDVQRIAEYFEHVTKPDGPLIEQTGWGMILSQIPHSLFPEERYKLRGGIDSSSVCKHFTKPRRHEMFARGIDEARKRIGV